MSGISATGKKQNVTGAKLKPRGDGRDDGDDQGLGDDYGCGGGDGTGGVAASGGVAAEVAATVAIEEGER